MKISCIECQQQLGELINSEAGGETEANADVRAHVATCDECQRDLALMRAARDELRSFSNVVAPPDLRALIREEIATTPNPLPEVKITPQLIVEVERTRKPEKKGVLHTVRKHGVQYFRGPLRVAWSSALALCLLCFALMLRPNSESGLLLPVEDFLARILDKNPDADDEMLSPSDSDQSQRGYYGEPVQNTASRKFGKPVPAKSGAAKNTAKPNATQPALPGQPPLLPVPPNLLPGGRTIFSERAPDVMTPFVIPDQTFVAPGVTPAPRNIPSGPAGNSAANAITKTLPKPATRPSASPATTSPTAPPPAGPSGPSEVGRRSSAASRRPDNTSTGGAATFMAPSAPIAQPRERSQPRIAAAKSSGSESARDSSNQDSAPQTMRRAENAGPASRSVVARIVAPRDMNWGQLSVVLPDGVRFEDGGRARVLWRGAVGGGESVEVRFAVRAESGSHDIRISLQEVVKGEAQTLARDSVSVSGR